MTGGTRATAGGTLAEAVLGAYEEAIDRVLATRERVTTAEEGKALLSSDERTQAVTDNVQKVAMFAVPVLRAMSKASRFSGVPWALVASTTVSLVFTLRAGVREVQVLASLVAERIEHATGAPAESALVKKLAFELYLSPGSKPDLSDRRLRPGRLLARWLFRGVLGRKTSKSAVRALEAAERLEMHRLVAEWSALDAPAPGARDESRDTSG